MIGTLLSLDLIRTDGGTQPRHGIDFDAVDDYTLEMRAGTVFPPIVVFFDGATYWLADGFHRYKAAEQTGTDDIACDIRQGTLQDAQWFSFGANKTNGLRRTNDDKQRAVKAALLHRLGAGKSDHQIAKHVGVAVSTVGDWRKKLESSVGILQMHPAPRRTVTRNGNTYLQHTANIGKSATGAQLSAPAPAPETAKASDPPAAGQPPAGSLTAIEWSVRIIRACSQIANCPVSANDLATYIAQITEMEKANEYITAILDRRRPGVRSAGDRTSQLKQDHANADEGHAAAGQAVA